tara:strand:- start:1623 stop:1811 length:189 start_codon:yes stop_codon:yes gene_type:complete
MTEQIPEAGITSENESKANEIGNTIEVIINPKDLNSEDLFQLFEVSTDEDSIWVNFGVGGPA